MDLNSLRDWIGRTENRSDRVGASTVAGMAAMLDRRDIETGPGSDVPPLWHWAFFTPLSLQSELGPDGHARRGGFLPPVPLPRRMWAGGRLEFNHPLQVGDEIKLLSRISDVVVKEGRQGTLVFVTVRHEITNARGLALSEEHDIVYRDHAQHQAPPTASAAPASPLNAPTTTPQPATEAADFSRSITPDPVLLFRFSALTFNGHRIHYDRDYATVVEGYPGLVVHGPLIAMLLMGLAQQQRPEARVLRFGFKALRPLFDIHRFQLCGRRSAERQLALWALDPSGLVAMQATVEFTSSSS